LRAIGPDRADIEPVGLGEGIRIAGRSIQGVIVVNTAEDEHVVSVEHIGEDTENGNGGQV
jgi:hypothetical protein